MQSHCERCVWGCISVRASGRSWLLRTVLRPRWDLEVPIRSSSCAVQRDCMGLLPFSSRQRAVCWPPCVPGARGRLHCVCGRPCGRVCRARGRSVRKDGKTALAPAAVATKRLPVCGQRDTNGFTAPRGCRHRGTDQPASLRRSRRPERRRSSTSRRPRSAALVEMLCPYEEQQPMVELPM